MSLGFLLEEAPTSYSSTSVDVLTRFVDVKPAFDLELLLLLSSGLLVDDEDEDDLTFCEVESKGGE